MTSIPGTLQNLLDELSLIEDTSLRYELLIEYGERFKEVPEEIATRPFPEECKVPACESDAYIFSTRNSDGTLKFHFAVENPQGVSAKALACILDETLSGEKIEEVSHVSEDIAYSIFGKNLSMGKGLGLTSMIRSLREIVLRELRSS
jgi:cysteine desulfuration protein SufE